MSTVNVVLGQIRTRAQTGLTMPVYSSVPVATETINSSNTGSTASTISSPVAANGYFWTVTAINGNVWAKFGTNPVANTGSDWLILSGTSRDFAVSAASEKIAVRDA